MLHGSLINSLFLLVIMGIQGTGFEIVDWNNCFRMESFRSLCKEGGFHKGKGFLDQVSISQLHEKIVCHGVSSYRVSPESAESFW